jgi:23S rRNA A2030 N6-methylase RlmJ
MEKRIALEEIKNDLKTIIDNYKLAEKLAKDIPEEAIYSIEWDKIIKKNGFKEQYSTISKKYEPIFNRTKVYLDPPYESSPLEDFLTIFIALYEQMENKQENIRN